MRLEARDGGGWVEVANGEEPPERVKDAPGDWTEVSAGATDADGRCRDLAHDAAPGVYRLTFDTGDYLRRQGRRSIYPEISVTFACDGETHYHLPLLLSDNGYTTYRGS